MARKHTFTLSELPAEIYSIVEVAAEELVRAQGKHAPMRSAHEGYAVIKEELDELWDEIKKKQRSRLLMMEEATQIAAMAMRFMLDVARNG